MTTGNNRSLREAVRIALLSAGTLAAGLATSTSIAQEQPAPASDQTASASPIAEVVVTGSRIATPSLESVSPITAVTAAEIKDQGVTRVEDLLNSLPQVVSDQGSGLSMAANGTATVNLRGLGPQRTLVLIDGRRLMGGDPAAGAPSNSALFGSSVADINQIPVALIERVDVLTGGAASTYGADAVAGVVNFVMNDHFEGVRLDVNAGIYNHSNHEGWMDPLLTKTDTPVPTGTNWDGANKDLTLILGHNFADGAGNFEGYLGYRRTSPITANTRDHSACVLDNQLDLTSPTSFGPYSCHGSINSAPSIIFPNATGPGIAQVLPNGTLNTTGPYQTYNFAGSHYLQRIDERYTAGFFTHLKFNDHAEAYSEFMFMDDNTRGNYAPAGLFLGAGFATSGTPALRDGNFYTNCGVGGFGNAGMNPYLTASEFGAFCGPTSGFNQGGTVPVPGDIQLLIARRNIEGGPRNDTYVHNTFRGVFGMRGEITTDWTYDSSITFGQTRSSDYHDNDVSASRAQNALLAVPGPNGTIVCRGGQPGCVPWNVFNPAVPVTQAQLNYVEVPALLNAFGTEDIFTSFVNGDLTSSVKLPMADEGLKVVFGTEYRREQDELQPDSEYLTGDLGNVIVSPYSGGYHVWEAFTEERLPLAKNQPGIKSLDIEAGYRYSSYSSGFDTNTFKVGLTYSPVSDVRFRGSYNRAVRVPNPSELYKPTVVELDGGTDLCADGPYVNNPAACALTNGGKPITVPTLSSPAGQYNGVLGGNPNLKPEVGKTTDVGVVLTPTFLPGFSATVDYSDIKITNVITTYGPNLIQNNCILSGSATSYFCELIHRDPNGTLWASPQGYTMDPLLNIAGLENKSVDIGLAYRVNMGAAGILHSRLDGTYLIHLLTNPGGGVATYDCAGSFGPSCSPVTPKWRHRFTLDWDTPFAGFSTGATWRFFGSATNSLLNPSSPDYIGAAIIDRAGPPSDARIPTISYLDLHASYVWNNITLRVGVNNVLDKDPPFIDTVNTGGNSTFAESNTYPSVYDMAGRYLFANVTIDF
jgi:iron complex outermembrane recepter protein